MVLCDMSALNPNVFFEFGIRTALNRPVCVVKDEKTKKVPFDTSILNYHEYASSLETWEIEKEISKLVTHIKESDTRGKGENDLWRYFGIKSEAKAFEGPTGPDAKLEYMMTQMDSLLRKVDRVARDEIPVSVESDIATTVALLLPPGSAVSSVRADPGHCTATVWYTGEAADNDVLEYAAKVVMNESGYSVKFQNLPF